MKQAKIYDFKNFNLKCFLHKNKKNIITLIIAVIYAIMSYFITKQCNGIVIETYFALQPFSSVIFLLPIVFCIFAVIQVFRKRLSTFTGAFLLLLVIFLVILPFYLEMKLCAI